MNKKDLLLGQLREMIRNEIRSALLPEEEHDFNKDLRAMGYNSLDAYNRDNPDHPMTNPYDDAPTERPRRRLPPMPRKITQADIDANRKAQAGWNKVATPYDPRLDQNLKGPERDAAIAKWYHGEFSQNPSAYIRWFGEPPAKPQEEAVVIQPTGNLKDLLAKLRNTPTHTSKTPVQIIKKPEIDYLPGDEGEPGDPRKFGEDDVEEVLIRLRETQTYKNKK